jgi:hypothetical protein
VKFTFRLILLFTAASLFQLASAVTVDQIDTFQTGIDNWFAGGLGFGVIPPIPPHVVPNGGPKGAGDQFMVVTSQGGNGPGSKLVAMNLNQWAGNYFGVTGIEMDLQNMGTTDLTIRLLMEDPMGGPPADEGVTTLGAFLPVGSGWTHFFFPLSTSALTMLGGDAATLLGNTTLLRIIDSPTPGDAVPIAGILGVDNIHAVPEPATVLFTGIALAGFALSRRRRSSPV